MTETREIARVSSWESQMQQQLHHYTNAYRVIHCYEEVESTMDVARHIQPKLKLGHYGLILAARQTKGRGTHGRTWLSSENSLAVTYVFNGRIDAAAVSNFSLVVGCAVKEFCDGIGAAVKLKWPNDVLSADKKKLSGVLIQSSTISDGTSLAVGIGMNLLTSPMQLPTATSLYEISGKKISAVSAGAALGIILANYWETYLEHGFEHFREQWLASAAYLGEKICFDLGGQAKENILCGKMKGISSSGSLVLETVTGDREVISGHMIEESVCC